MEENRILFLGLFLDDKKEDGDYYLIPVTAWRDVNALFKDRTCKGKKSPPEWGLNFSEKNMHLLEQYSFRESLKRIISKTS